LNINLVEDIVEKYDRENAPKSLVRSFAYHFRKNFIMLLDRRVYANCYL